MMRYLEQKGGVDRDDDSLGDFSDANYQRSLLGDIEDTRVGIVDLKQRKIVVG